jgi:hypothetical protein
MEYKEITDKFLILKNEEIDAIYKWLEMSSYSAAVKYGNLTSSEYALLRKVFSVIHDYKK